MRYLETHHFPGDVNMALDVILGELSLKMGPILRVYSWERPTLSLGRHQRESDVDFEALNELGIGCVRRPSGGRAVLHFHEVTYSVAFPRWSEEYSMKTMELYRMISGVLMEGLKKLGFEVEMDSGRGWMPKNPSCFSSGARGEIKIDGKKVVGSAQFRTEDFVLQHGSILLRGEWGLLSAVLSSHPSPVDLSKSAVGLAELRGVSFREVADAIIESFDEEYSLDWMDYGEVLAVLEDAKKIRGDFSCQSSTWSQRR